MKAIEEILKFEVTGEVFLVKGTTKDRILKKGKIKFIRKESEPFKYFLNCEDLTGEKKPFFFPILENTIIECFTSKKGNKELNFTYMNYQYLLQQNGDTLRIRLDYTTEADEVESMLFGNFFSKLVYETTNKKCYTTVDSDDEFAKFLREVSKDESSILTSQS